MSLMSLMSLMPLMPLIQVGQKAPAFALRDTTGAVHHLKDYLGRPVALYFYPKDDTPGCTDQACQFRDRTRDFDRATAIVLGVSPDSVESHAAFAEKLDLRFPLLVDTFTRKGTPKTCDRYGVWQEKALYGKKYFGVVRTTYLIDEAGKVARRWDRVSVDGHVAEVLSAVHEIRRVIPQSARSMLGAAAGLA